MDRPPHLAPILRVPAARIGVPSASQLYDISAIVLHHSLALDEACVSQANFGSWCKTKPPLGRRFREVLPVDAQSARKGEAARTAALIVGVPGGLERVLL